MSDSSTGSFAELNLHASILSRLEAIGFATPTPIQSAIIPRMHAHVDVLAQSQTGSGKTAAFALPILDSIAARPRGGIQALVLAPTRELALQVSEAIHDYGMELGVSVLAVYGGAPYGPQKYALKRGVDVVVGTPGRLLDLMRREYIDLGEVRTVVLDEADEMLSMGFIEDIEAILSATPAERQTTLFSATLPSSVRVLARKYMRDPEVVTIEQEQMTVATIEQRYYLVNEADKTAAITRLFEIEPMSSVIIFTRTRASTGDLAAELTKRGFPAEPLNGDLTQDARERVLNRFRGSTSMVLVATDVAARGLDVDDISHVINYDLPEEVELYVHRVGRTARAGRSGVAISLVTPREKGRIRQIENYTRQKITRAMIPTEEEIIHHRESQLVGRLEVWLKRDRFLREREMVSELVELGYDPMTIAAAALKLSRAEEKQRPIYPVTEVVEKPERVRETRQRSYVRREGEPVEITRTSHEEGMVRLALSRGKAHGVRPNDVVGAIARLADIPGNTIGRIKIQEQETFVDVPAEYVSAVIAKTGKYKIHRFSVDVRIA